MKIFLFILFMTLSQTAVAEEALVVCKIITTHKSSENVRFQPGVDVRGKPVVSADLHDFKSFVPDIIKVPLTIDLAERIDTAVTGNLLEAPLGLLEIHQNGQVLYNGEDWTSAINTACNPAEYEHPKEQKGYIDNNTSLEKQIIAKEIKPAAAIPPRDVPQGTLLFGGEFREEGIQ